MSHSQTKYRFRIDDKVCEVSVEPGYEPWFTAFERLEGALEQFFKNRVVFNEQHRQIHGLRRLLYQKGCSLEEIEMVCGRFNS